VYEIALTVAACLRAGTRVDVAWAVETNLQPFEATGALAITPGGGRVGSLLGGALDDQVVERTSALGETGRVVTLSIGDLEARAFGLAGAGTATAVVLPAHLLPVELWPALLEREAVRLVVSRQGDVVTGVRLEAPEGHDPGAAINETEVVTTWHPVPTVVLAGGGPVLEALEAMAPLLGWRTQHAGDPDTARSLVVGLGPLDTVVLAMHDVDLAGPVLASALEGNAGYVAALGSRAMQQSRETWLTDRGVGGIERIHTPAGLDIGADGPAEVAVAILAQAIRERTARAQAKA
jgi:xanthine dehydrogenase accessory factor